MIAAFFNFICNLLAATIVIAALAVVAFVYGSQELVQYLNENYIMIPKN